MHRLCERGVDVGKKLERNEAMTKSALKGQNILARGTTTPSARGSGALGIKYRNKIDRELFPIENSGNCGRNGDITCQMYYVKIQMIILIYHE